jgi:hypothetical protein
VALVLFDERAHGLLVDEHPGSHLAHEKRANLDYWPD